MELPVFADGERRGAVKAAQGEGWMDFHLCAPDLGAGLWRITLEGDAGEVLLGIAEGGMHRRLSGQLLSRAGVLRQARAERVDTGTLWRAVGGRAPAGTMVRRRGEGWEAAIPWTVGTPFPGMEYFCFASVDGSGGRLWVHLAFDGAGRPVFGEEI